MDPDNPIGTYLVRPSESGQTAISLKIFDKNKQKLAINHYIIQTVESNGSMFYFIGNGSKYPSINKLIQRYTSALIQILSNYFLFSMQNVYLF